jgi:hypothetical protein
MLTGHSNQRLRKGHAERRSDQEQFGGQPFTYDLFDALKLSEFGHRELWFVGLSGPRNCCWACGITPQFRRHSSQRGPSTASWRVGASLLERFKIGLKMLAHQLDSS